MRQSSKHRWGFRPQNGFSLSFIPDLISSLDKHSGCLMDDFLDDLSGRLDFSHQAYALSGKKVHGLEISNSVPSRGNSSEASQRHAHSAEAHFPYSWLIG